MTLPLTGAGPSAGGVAYLLRDEFTDTRAAGSVNGTAATPGPGTRTVVDTDGDALSVAGGVLVLANVNSSWDPVLFYDGRTRTAGRVWMGTYTAAATEACAFGWHNGQAGRADFEGFYFRSAGNVNVTTAGGLHPVVATHAAGAYQLAVVLRSTGAYFFIKGVAFTNWTLLWITASNNTSTLYPGFSNYDAVGTGDSFRIPDVLWLPTPIAYDTFTRANGALGSTETTGPDSQSVSALTWNNRVGTTQIATNKASASALVGGIALATVDTGTANVVMEGTCTRAGNEVGIVLRYAGADNYIRAIHDGTNCKLVKRVAAAETDVISAVVALGAGKIAVHADGTSFSLFLNNAKVDSTSTISDAGLQTGTEHGLFSTNTSNTQDAFLVMPRGGGAYAKLDSY